MKDYDPKSIESKWQKEWKKEKLYEASEDKKDKYYFLVEFPYPSGNLHVGHWYAFAVADIAARFHRMLGKNVMFPIGFDAFGLPAENAAIKRKLNPREWTFSNIEYMKGQLRSMGNSFDWSREVITCDPEYYKWTQWMFLKFFEKGLAYQAESEVNWCPSCKTVLANEQVVNGYCERCGTEVIQKKMLQWQLKITDYADRLINDLESLDWSKPIKEAQKNWIGRSEGALIKFGDIEVFTTRPDTIFGATFIVVAGKEDKFTGKYVTNPATAEKIPVWEAEYVMEDYGTGAIMAVPAHDERDYEFARKHDLPVKHVIMPRLVDHSNPHQVGEETIKRSEFENTKFNHSEDQVIKDRILRGVEVYTGEGILINSGEFSQLESPEGKSKIPKRFGIEKVSYKLRDWVVSRQRYWGVPIPVLHCEKCGVVAVPEKDLPVILPEIDDYLPRDDGKSPLSKAESWVKITCPKCGGKAERETDTLDTFVDSSWYFLRYTDPRNDKEFASPLQLKKWLPVDFYSGGAEHTTMHLLYSRFWHKALHDFGLVNESEPYLRRMNRGIILGPDSQKMSKSKGNVIDPDKEVERLGADTVRTYLAFIGPYNEVGAYPWNPDASIGVRRFLERVWRFQAKLSGTPTSSGLIHPTIKKVTDEIRSLKLNTAVSALMIWVNELDKQEKVSKEEYEILLKLLAPFAPHMTEELWHELGHEGSIHTEPWPKYDESKLATETVTIIVQVNGKVRSKFIASSSISKEEAIEEAQTLPEIQKWVGDREVDKTIYVSQKLVNLVLT